MNNPDLRRTLFDFHAVFLQQMTDNLEAENRRFDQINGVDPDNRPTRYVERPRDPEWLVNRDDFGTRWEALIEEGLDHDYLTALSGNEAPEYVLNKDTTEWVEEPNPDYDPDKPNPYALPQGATSITILRASRGDA